MRAPDLELLSYLFLQESFLAIRIKRISLRFVVVCKENRRRFAKSFAEPNTATINGHHDPDYVARECELIDGSYLAGANRLAVIEGGASGTASTGLRRSLQTLTPELRRTGSGVIDYNSSTMPTCN